MIGDLRPNPLLETRALLIYSIVDSFSQKVSDNKSFESRLKHLLNTYNVRYKNKEARFFVKSRNCIAHEFRFKTPDARDEYFKNLNLYHRLILGMLGYDGYYIDVTDAPFKTGSRKHKFEVSNWNS